jgi:hypothetical protein
VDEASGFLTIDPTTDGYSAMDEFWPNLATRGTVPGASPSILVDYRGGYSTIPEDIQLLCMELVKVQRDAKNMDGTITGESLGGYSYTLNNSAGNAGMSDSVIADRISAYRRGVVVA